MSIECPECGKKINEVLGQLPDECPFCETDITELVARMAEGADEVMAAPRSAFVAAPGAPSAPGAPAAPSVPKAPGAPR